jgi:NAD+ synthase (glutamine-hydrolysing)
VSALVNPSASPFHAGKPRFRERMLAEVAAENRTPVLFVNQVGGNDELVFDGGSLAIGPDGRTVSRSPLFREHVALVELGEDGSLAGELSPWPDRAPEVLREAIVLGLGDYVRKCGFGHVVLGLSGGIDSALVAVLACEALGAGNVTALAMPSRFSSEASLRDAQLVASNLGIRLEVVSIEPAFDALVGTLDPWFAGTGFGLAEENLQARVRGTLVMAFSNKFGGLALATGNKSEIAVGYCTLYGDMVGAVAPIGDVLKTDVYEIARHINAGSPVIPGSILNKAPSAELRPGQKDEDTLPPYAELDNVLRRYLEEDAPVEEIVAGGVARETVARILEMVRRAEHKRSQAALVIRVSPRAFGPGRRYPIAQGFRE